MGLKEALTCSLLFVDGSGQLDVEIEVDSPDGGLELGHSQEAPHEWVLKLRGK